MAKVHPLRASNRHHILSTLTDAGAAFRPELAERLGLSLMAVTRITRELTEVGLIREGTPNVRAEPGRPPIDLTINPAGGFVLGFEVHAFAQSMVLMDLARRVVRRHTFQLSSATDGARSLAEFARQAKREIRAAGVDPLRVIGTGVALTGTVDRERGRLLEAPYLGWSSLDVVQSLQAQLEMPVVIDRIANAQIAAEARSAAQPLSDALLFNIGFALSAAILVGGTIAQGDRLLAGQVGHMATDDKRLTCSCGRQGCLNVAGSGWAALAALGQIDDHVLSAEEFQRDRPRLAALLSREAARDPQACNALRQVGRTLGRTIRPLQIALDPGRIFLSGPVGRAASFVEGATEGIGEDLAHLIACSQRRVDESAALLAFNEFVCSPRLDFERLRTAKPVKAVAATRAQA